MIWSSSVVRDGLILGTTQLQHSSSYDSHATFVFTKPPFMVSSDISRGKTSVIRWLLSNMESSRTWHIKCVFWPSSKVLAFTASKLELMLHTHTLWQCCVRGRVYLLSHTLILASLHCTSSREISSGVVCISIPIITWYVHTWSSLELLVILKQLGYQPKSRYYEWNESAWPQGCWCVLYVFFACPKWRE